MAALKESFPDIQKKGGGGVCNGAWLTLTPGLKVMVQKVVFISVSTRKCSNKVEVRDEAVHAIA